MSKEENHITTSDELQKVELLEEDLLTTEQNETEKLPQETAKEESNRNKLLNSLMDEDEEKTPEIRQWKDIWHAMSIDGQWFKRQIGVILMVVAGIILYITFRYQAQQEMIEEDNLRKELLDWKYRSMTRNSELTLRTRQSQLEQMLKANGDSTLKASITAPFALENE